MIRNPRSPNNLAQKDQVLGVQAVTGQNLGQGDEKKISVLAIKPRWAIGPRTPAWEELWRRILSDLLYTQGDVADSTVREPSNDC